ncbi:aminopeptidase P N-terminal domain-containing protein [Candidatus Babeliales bacterium]|nr:aminopeptidase P N-terminal domain-containing protein [Candidatus Babeliales bacterium]
MIFNKNNYQIFKQRRDYLLSLLRKEFPLLKKGIIFLFADFESERTVFRQDSSFYYLTGITEPGAVLLICLDGRQVLYLPNYGGIRQRWIKDCLIPDQPGISQILGVSQIKYLGDPCGRFSFSPIFSKDNYKNLLLDFSNFLNDNFVLQEEFEIFTLLDNMNSKYFMQINLYKIFLDIFPQIKEKTRDLGPLIHNLRRIKSEYEIDLIYKAVQITTFAHQAASKIIESERFEYEIQAIIESVFMQAGAKRPAFPSIVASGKNTTVLHYQNMDQKLKEKDLIVVDIGAEYDYYAADITRTYPIGGKFTERQRQIYDIVLQTQSYVESIAKPGIYLNNKNEPEKSLHHLAVKFLEKKDLEKYIVHGIGHFLGLDVHDVGDCNYPLVPGDVFTIEPGIYIPQENLGIRIEDDYLMTDQGVVCLSFQLPKTADEIEKMMQNSD